jgi:thiol:disulfide interchange protein DsbC
MLSMSKLLASILLLSSFFAFNAWASPASQQKELLIFLKKRIAQNPGITGLKIEITGHKLMERPKGWTAYTVVFHAEAKMGNKMRPVTQRSVYFVKEGLITTEFIDMKTGIKLNDTITPRFKKSDYSKSNLLYGDADAKNKVVIFSDPLCPFCREYVPGALRYMKKYPKEFAVYYYNFPLKLIHPASLTVVKAALYQELQGDKSIILRLYSLKIDPRESDPKKILQQFNEQLGLHLTLSQINSVIVKDALKHDVGMGDRLMVRGTPTFYFNGTIDPTKERYKEVKVH